MRVFLNILNWLYDDSNLIKVLLIALAVLSILIFFFNVYYHKIVEKLSDRGRSRPYKRLRADWEPERPNDLTNSYDNPWDSVSSNTDEPKKSGRFGCVGIILIISLLAVIAVILFLLLNRGAA